MKNSKKKLNLKIIDRKYLPPTQKDFKDAKMPPQSRPITIIGAKFDLGVVGVTKDSYELFAKQGINLLTIIQKHARGDWGDLSDEDKADNDLSVKEGAVIFSKYETTEGQLWVITEADRSATTILTPDDYAGKPHFAPPQPAS